MENELTIDSNLSDNIVLDESCKEALKTTAQWAQIIAVITAVILIISVIVVLFTFSALPTAAPSFVSGVIFSYLISLGLLIYPLIALLGFNKKIKQSLEANA
jgi:membrane protein YdbS with pleckstrin-like domain